MRKIVITNEMGLPRMDLSALFPTRKYKPMDPTKKQEEVMALETKLREAAWHAGRLNPLIGVHNYSSEPTWDHERNVIQ